MPFDDRATGTTVNANRSPCEMQRVVGLRGWLKLSPDIRQRFASSPRHGEIREYVGNDIEIVMSVLGRYLSQLCRVFDSPLPRIQGTNIQSNVRLFCEPTGKGVVWERHYKITDKLTAISKTVKRFEAPNGLLECMGRGLGMTLSVYEEDRALHFVSQKYFWQVGRLRVRLPALLTPGRLHVIHSDLGNGNFRFYMTLTHKLFGTLVKQDGSFKERILP